MTDYQPLYATSRALIIGINAYADPRFMPLGSAEEDARAIGQVLSQPPYDFGMTLLLGKAATRTAILSALHDLRNTGPDDRIVVYFAGHGYTLADNFGQETGYLACADTVPDRDFTALELTEVTDLRRHAGAKHIAFIFDACFSGQALGLTRAPNIAAESFLLRRAYQVISAGAGDQTVSDFRSMTRLMLELLGSEDAPVDGMLTLSELGLQLQQRMAADSHQMQIPQFGHLQGSQGGELVWWAQEGDLLPPEMELALRSASANMRMGVVADLIALAGGDGNLSGLARERLAVMAGSDPEERVRRAAQSFFDEEQARQAIEEARRAREIIAQAEPAAERVRASAPAARKAIPWWMPVGGLVLVAAVVGGLWLGGVLKPAPAVDSGPAVPTQPGDEVMVYDDFSGSNLDESTWLVDPLLTASVQDDMLRLADDGSGSDRVYSVTAARFSDVVITEKTFFEGTLWLANGDGQRDISFGLISTQSGKIYSLGCGLGQGFGGSESEMNAHCEQARTVTVNWENATYDDVLNQTVAGETSHHFRLEIEPGTLKTWFYLDGDLVGTSQTDEPDRAADLGFNFDVSLWTDGSPVEARVDNLRIGIIPGETAENGETEIFSASFDSGGDDALAGFEIPFPDAIWIEDGSLRLNDATGSDGLHTYVHTSAVSPFKIDRPMFFESSLLLTEGSGERGINMSIYTELGNDRSWGAGCGLGGADPEASCGHDASIDSGVGDYSEWIPITYDTWHTVRIEVDPTTMLITYYIDGKVVGVLQPGDGETLREAAYNFDFSAWAYLNPGELAGRIDNVRVGYLDE